MIRLSQTANPSKHIRDRAKNCWVRTVAPDSYIVKPKDKGKARRAVNLLQDSRGIRIECVDKITGEPCKANQFGVHCSHTEAVINRILINAKREANRKAKAEAKGRNATRAPMFETT